MLNKYYILFLISFLSNFIVAVEDIYFFSYYGMFFLVFIYFGSNGLRQKIILNKMYITILTLFFLPIVFSIFSVVVNNFLIDDARYSFEVLMTGIPRLMNYLLMFMIFLFFVPLDKCNNIRNINWFYVSLLIYLVFGVWQFLHFYFDLPIIPFETRDMAHSVVGVGPTHRLTSIAREPSFFSPLLAEMFILSFFLRDIGWKKSWINILRWFILFVAVFTLSPSTYIEFFFIFLILLFRNKISFFDVVGIILILILIFSLFQYFDEFILYRIMNVSESTRFLQIETIFKTMFEMKFFTLLFGVGPKGLSYISQITKIDGTGAEIHSSTNNIFADLFVDNGLFGVFCLFMLFIYLYRKAFAIKFSNLPAMFFLHILVCCQYRGNYSSVRFIILIIILIALINFYKNRDFNNFHEQKDHSVC